MLPLRTATLVSTALLAAGCTIKPTPISDDVHRAHAAQALRQAFGSQEPVSEALTLADASARAVKYNLDYRVRMMEQAAALGQTELASWDLLPRLTQSAGYSTRSNDAFGFGFSPNGAIATTPSAAQERTRTTHNLGFAWSVLDFGMSYVRAKQLADQVLITEERRRKALQNVVQDVRTAWWKAEAAERLLPDVDAMNQEVEQYVYRARLIEARRLLPPLQIVAYRRSLFDLQQQLAARRQELVLAQHELGGLIQLRPGTPFKIAAQDESTRAMLDLTANVESLERIALENRPELREEAYKARITDLEWRKQVIGLLPNLGVDLGYNYDSNRYLVNNQWASAGLNLSFGLLRIFSLPAVNKASDDQRTVDETRRMALAGSVMVQTRMAAARYGLLANEYGVWDDAVRDDASIIKYLSSAGEVGLETELEIVRAKARHLISKINRDLVYASVQSAVGRLYNSIGLDSVPQESASGDAGDLGRALGSTIAQWEKTNFTERGTLALRPVSIGALAGVPAERMAAFREGMVRILRIARVPVEADAEHRIEATVVLESAQNAARPARVTVRIRDRSGALLNESEQRTTLVDPVGDEQWRTLGEGAAFRLSDPLRRMLRAARP